MQWAQDSGQASSGRGLGVDPRDSGKQQGRGRPPGSQHTECIECGRKLGAGGNHLAF